MGRPAGRPQLTVEDWSDFFVATAGASAALAGLTIVAVSVNVAEIVKYRPLPSRAGAAIGCLVAVLLCSMAGLAPQPEAAFGAEVLGVGLVAWFLHVVSARDVMAYRREVHRPLWESLQKVVLGQVQTLPLIAAGVLLLTGHEAGLPALFAAFLAIFALTMLDAWVLLIEILR